MLLSRKHKVHKLEMGFTLIEVMMFLAISSLMLVGILSSYSGTRQRSQFRDAVQQTVDNFRQLKTEANTTVNIEGSGNDENYVVAGQLAYFAVGPNQNQLDVRVIKAEADNAANFDDLPPARIETIPWGAYFSQATINSSEVACSAPESCYLAFYRDSASGQLHTRVDDGIALTPPVTAGDACLELQSPQGFVARINVNLDSNSVGEQFDAGC